MRKADMSSRDDDSKHSTVLIVAFIRYRFIALVDQTFLLFLLDSSYPLVQIAEGGIDSLPECVRTWRESYSMSVVSLGK
jgi:hypothetical protein